MGNVPNATGSMREEEYNPFEGYVSIAPAKTDNAPMPNCPAHYPPERYYFPQQVPPQKKRPNAVLFILLGIGIVLLFCVFVHVVLIALLIPSGVSPFFSPPASYEEVAGRYHIDGLINEYVLALHEDGTYTLYITDDTSGDYISGNFSLGTSMRIPASTDEGGTFHEGGQSMFLHLTYGESYLGGVRSTNPFGHDDWGKQLAMGSLFISDSGRVDISWFRFSYETQIESLDD